MCGQPHQEIKQQEWKGQDRQKIVYGVIQLGHACCHESEKPGSGILLIALTGSQYSLALRRKIDDPDPARRKKRQYPAFVAGARHASPFFWHVKPPHRLQFQRLCFGSFKKHPGLRFQNGISSPDASVDIRAIAPGLKLFSPGCHCCPIPSGYFPPTRSVSSPIASPVGGRTSPAGSCLHCAGRIAARQVRR